MVVLLPDIKFYRWMYWSNPFQYAMNVMTSISFYCNTKGCGSECKCPRLPDGSYVWDRLATLRSLSHERIDVDILILSTMCLLFASLACVFFVVLKHKLLRSITTCMSTFVTHRVMDLKKQRWEVFKE